MSISPAPQSASDQGQGESWRTERPRLEFIARCQQHPALALARPSREFLAELTAHPMFCLASRSSVQRWEVMFHCRPSLAQQWRVIGTDMALQQRRALLCRGALCALLVPRLLCLQGKCAVRQPLNLARCMASRRHFLGSYKDEAEGVFEEGQRLYGEQRFSEAAERWGRAALLQHGPSHAHLSNMLLEGRSDVVKDEARAFALACSGADCGCAHSKGVLGRCYVYGAGISQDVARGLALGRESAAAGSCFGQFVVGRCCYEGWCTAQDYAEAVRLWQAAAAHGHSAAQYNLGNMFDSGQFVGQDLPEAVRLWTLSASQGDAYAQANLAVMLCNGRGVARDAKEAARLSRLAAVQGHSPAQHNLGFMYEKGQGVARDREEAIRWFRLAAAQGYAPAKAALKRMG
jgi:TPR repeat protein